MSSPTKLQDFGSLSSFTASVGSTDEGNEDDDDEALERLEDAQIEMLLEETRRANRVLGLETEVFERAWKKFEEKEQQSAAFFQRQFSPSGGATDTPGGSSPRTGRKRSKSRGNIDRLTQRLTIEQKCDVAQREITRFRAETKATNEISGKAISNLKAVIKEARDRAASMKQDEQEFRREIAKHAVNPVTRKVNPDKAAKFWMEKLQDLDALNLKLRLKNTALKIRRKKVVQTLRQQEETGDVLMEIDFAQLTIENQLYSKRIEERNEDLIHLKLMTSRVLTILNAHRQRLNALLTEAKRLRVDIAMRLDLIRRIDNETATAEDERGEAEKINQHLIYQMENFQVPETFYYVEAKADIFELKKKLQIWQRKTEITAMALHTKRNVWHRLVKNACPQKQQVKATTA